MEFRILGPLEVTDGDGAISFDAPKQRALLGVLLLHPNEVVSSERLIDELWGERPPATAGKVVQNYISQLRKAVGTDVIVTRPPGYMLRIEQNALDATRFRHLTNEGRTLAAKGDQARAYAAYQEALALWRGPPLADVVFGSSARNELQRLEEERLRALTDRIDCELALGRHDGLVAELETLVGQYPLRERLRAQLMLALYRSGRQADALAAYQDARRTLADELGLEPGAELQALERAILTHDATLEARPVVPRERSARQRIVGWRAISIATLVLLAVVVGLAFGLRGGEPAPILLTPNSVGFVDAETGRVMQAFPVCREPTALAVANDSVWVACYREKTVTRIDRESGPTAPIPVGGHPIDITSFRGRVWVWTLEGLLVAIDRPDPIRVPINPTREGGIVASGNFLWLTAPPTAVIRVDPERPERRFPPISPPFGTAGPIASGEGEVWVAGSEQVFPIPSHSDIPLTGAAVGGIVRDVAVSGGSVWVLSGGPNRVGGSPRLRRVDRRTRFPQTTIAVGQNPRVVAVTDDSAWVGGRDGSGGTVYRVDTAGDRVVDIISVGAIPSAIAADREGVWVAAT